MLPLPQVGPIRDSMNSSMQWRIVSGLSKPMEVSKGFCLM